MHILSLKICGFRSFKDEALIENFSPGFNVIVGQNGAGKSNILLAIQLALTDEFNTLHPMAKVKMISSGRNPNNPAFVEVALDNKDRILPIEADVIHLRRFIGRKKEKLLINGKEIRGGSKLLQLHQVLNSLYFVKQGAINEIATCSDAKRLDLLKECTGYNLWERPRTQSLIKLADIREKMKVMQSTLSELQDERKLLVQEAAEYESYHASEKKLKSLQFIILDMDAEKIKRKLRDLEKKRNRYLSIRAPIKSEIYSMETQLVNFDVELKVTIDAVSDIESTKTQILRDLENALIELSRLTNEIEELEAERRRLRELHDSIDPAKSSEEITRLQEKLELVNRELDQVSAEERIFYTKISIARSEMRLLEEKLVRNAFGNDEGYLRRRTSELEYFKSDLTKAETQLVEANEKMAMMKKEYDLENQELEKCGLNTLTSLSNCVQKARNELGRLTFNRNEILSRQRENWVLKSSIQTELANYRDKLHALENSMLLPAGRNISKGYECVKKIIHKFEQSANPQDKFIAENYFGLLFENINVPKEYELAVEAAGGKKLYFHVVKNRTVGMKILREFNLQKYCGEVNILPENDLVVYNTNAQKSNLIAEGQAELLIDKIDYTAYVMRAVENTFGNYLLCRDISNILSRSKGSKSWNFVNLEGDLVNRKGPMTGGYRNSSKSILKDQSVRLVLKKNVASGEEALEKIIEEECSLAQLIQDLSSRIDDLQSGLVKKTLEIQRMQDHRKTLSFKIVLNETAQSQQQDLLEKLSRAIHALKEDVERISEDIYSEFNPPSFDCKTKFEYQKESLKRLLKRHTELSTRHNLLKKEKSNAEFHMKVIKSRLEDRALECLDEMNFETIDKCISVAKENLCKKNEEKLSLDQKLNDVETCLAERIGQVTAMKLKIENLQSNLSDKTTIMEDQSRLLNSMTAIETGLHRQFEEMIEKYKDLGNRPSHFDSEALKMNLKQLYQTISDLTEVQMTSSVNLKAIIELAQVQEKLDTFEAQIKESETSLKAIESCLNLASNMVPVNTMELIRKIQCSFQEIHAELASNSKRIPDISSTGAATLVITSNDEEVIYDENSYQLQRDEMYEAWENGVFVAAKFKVGCQRDTRALSGGQKSLLGISFIFAIQKHCPSKIFLFDEVDQALDKDNRCAVAEKMKALSKEVQFLCTTFSNQFLEVADNIYAVSHQRNGSHVKNVGTQNAMEFVESSASSATQSPPQTYIIFERNEVDSVKESQSSV